MHDVVKNLSFKLKNSTIGLKFIVFLLKIHLFGNKWQDIQNVVSNLNNRYVIENRNIFFMKGKCFKIIMISKCICLIGFEFLYYNNENSECSSEKKIFGRKFVVIQNLPNLISFLCDFTYHY